MNICVLGLWHLGCVTAASLATLGNQVVGLDYDVDLVRGLKNGKPPVFETGLIELVAQGIESGSLKFISSLEDLNMNFDFLWVTYDTPVNENDVANVDFVFQQIELTLPQITVDTTIIISSQLPVGSIKRLEKIIELNYSEKRLTVVCAPENLRLGNAINIFLNQERVVLGVRNQNHFEKLVALFTPITENIKWMKPESAEMTKHALNSFLALSIAYANEVARVCEVVGASYHEVEDGLKSDQRIGSKAYLSSGNSYAGGTLARDVEFFKEITNQNSQEFPLLNAIRFSNQRHKYWAFYKIKELWPDLSGLEIVVWGLTYKSGTSTLRRSLAVELVDLLILEGALIRVHDDKAEDLPASWTKTVQRFQDPIEALKKSKVLLIGTPSSDYKEILEKNIESLPQDITIIDAGGYFAGLKLPKLARYMSVGLYEERFS
jgi:UDPglucose 6-dehydrogenase